MFRGVLVTRSLALCVCFVDRCLSFCTFFFWPLCCLFFFDIRILITPLVSSNSFYLSNNFHNVSTMHVQQFICQTYATIYMLNICHTISVKHMPHFICHTNATMYLSFPCNKLPVKPMPQFICLTYVTICPSNIPMPQFICHTSVIINMSYQCLRLYVIPV